MIPATRLARADAWSPITLFTSGLRGFLYDPQNLSAISQDTAGATAVSATTNPVGRCRDMSGNELHGTRYTDDTHRAVWTATTDGYPYLGFSAGSPFGYSVPLGLTSAVTALTCCAAVYFTDFTNSSTIFSSQTPTDGNDRWTFYAEGGTAALSFFARRLDADAGSGLVGPTLTAATNYVVLGEMDYANAKAEMRANRTIFRSNFLTAGATSATNSFGNGFGVFLDSGPDSWLRGRCFACFMLMGRILSEGEKRMLMNWMGRKCGLVI